MNMILLDYNYYFKDEDDFNTLFTAYTLKLNVVFYKKTSQGTLQNSI